MESCTLPRSSFGYRKRQQTLNNNKTAGDCERTPEERGAVDPRPLPVAGGGAGVEARVSAGNQGSSRPSMDVEEEFTDCV